MTNINSENLTSIIEAYKVYFKEYFSFEIYKWKAVEYFQTYWNMEAVNFKEMLVQAFSKTKNLLSSMNNYPQKMLQEFCEITNEMNVGDVVFAKKGRGCIIHSANMYQIFTYVKNLDVEDTGKVSGLLLYAKTDEEITPDLSASFGKNRIHVRTLDLNQEFSGMTRQLEEFLEW